MSKVLSKKIQCMSLKKIRARNGVSWSKANNERDEKKRVLHFFSREDILCWYWVVLPTCSFAWEFICSAIIITPLCFFVILWYFYTQQRNSTWTIIMWFVFSHSFIQTFYRLVYSREKIFLKELQTRNWCTIQMHSIIYASILK